ncbi:MAG: agmatinase, partial [Flavobacteriales bacterium]|nr:agmatinase [Flavobacteriales bacterium]
MNRLYAGMDSPLSASGSHRAVIIPVPYDGTSTWGKGADRGPAALLNATDNMEVYD